MLSRLRKTVRIPLKYCFARKFKSPIKENEEATYTIADVDKYIPQEKITFLNERHLLF